MKKTLATLSAIVLAGANLSAAATGPLVSIDSISIMQKSQEGQKIAAKIQKEVEAFQEQIKNAQKELVDAQENITKQSKLLSKEAIQEKTEELASKKKNMEQDLANKEEKLRARIQKEQIALRDKQLKITNEVFEKQGWGLLVDKNAPGVLCVSNAIDKTDVVLKAVDEKYTSETKTVALNKATKPAAAIKTTTKPAATKAAA